MAHNYFRFSSDSQAELDLVCELSRSAGAADAVIANHFAEGGRGAAELAGAISRACASVRQAREPTFRCFSIIYYRFQISFFPNIYFWSNLCF